MMPFQDLPCWCKENVPVLDLSDPCDVTFWPPPTSLQQQTHAGALINDMLDLKPLEDMPTDEDRHYWMHGDDEEDEITVRAMLDAEDPCGRANIEEITDD